MSVCKTSEKEEESLPDKSIRRLVHEKFVSDDDTSAKRSSSSVAIHSKRNESRKLTGNHLAQFVVGRIERLVEHSCYLSRE